MGFTTNDIIIVYPIDRVAGGRLGYDQATSGQGGNLIPLALPSDLSAGREVHRKIGFRIADSNNGVGAESFLRKWKEISGEYAFSSFFPVSRLFLNSAIAGSEEKYGTGVLKYAVTSTDTTLVVTVRSTDLATGSDAIFNDEKKISVCLAAQGPTSDTGLQSLAVVDGAPSNDGVDVTIDLAAAIGADYPAGSLVQSYPDEIDIETSYENVVETSTAGVFDEAQIVLDNIGTPTLSVTITFTSATTFNAVGDYSGIVTDGSSSMGTGSITVAFAPTNRFNSQPIFTLPVGIFTGTWASGDTVEFDINGAEYCFVEKHVIPASAVSVAGDYEDYALQTSSV